MPGVSDKFTGSFTGTSTVFATANVSYGESLTTLPGGIVGRTRTFSTLFREGGRISFAGRYRKFESSGTRVAIARIPPSPGAPFGASVLTTPFGGNGKLLDASGSISLSAGAETASFINGSATTPDGQDFDTSDITGTAGFGTSADSSGTVAQSLVYQDQTSSGSPSADTDEHDYLSIDLSHNATGSTDFGVGAAFPLHAGGTASVASSPVGGMIPGSGTTTTAATAASISSGGGSGGGTSSASPLDIAANYEKDDGGNSTFSLTFSGKDRSTTSLGGERVDTNQISVSLSGVTSAEFGVEVNGVIPSATATVKGDLTAGVRFVSTTVVNDPLAESTDVAPLGTDYEGNFFWSLIETYGYELSNTFDITVGVPAIGDPTVSGDWDYTLTITSGDRYKRLVTQDWTDPVTGNSEFSRTLGSEFGQDVVLTGSGSLSSGSINWTVDVTPMLEVTTIITGTPGPPVVDNSPPPKSDNTSTLLDNIQFGLDLAGMVPVIGEAADLINAGIHLGRGNYADAALSIVAMVPLAGNFATGGKFLKKASGAIAEYGDEFVDATKQIRKRCDSLSTCFVAGTPVVTHITNVPVLAVEEVPDEDSSSSIAFIGVGVSMAVVRSRLNRRKPRSPAPRAGYRRS